jgi:hypothetical protein
MGGPAIEDEDEGAPAVGMVGMFLNLDGLLAPPLSSSRT